MRILRDSGPFSEEKALKIALQIAHALDHAHKHNLIHRDIKPDNIMVTPRDEAKLCDLGLAKVTDSDASQTRSSVAVGTPHYIAPEQARGESGVGITADIYALGATLYHMTTGATLFQGDSSRDIMAQHLTDEAPNARKLRAELSEPFARMLEKMLAKAPKERYQTPAELAEDIERVLEKKPIKSALPPIAKCSMERTKAGRKDATTGPRAPIERSTTGPRSPIDRPEPDTGPKKAVSSGRPLIVVAAVAVLALGVGVGLAVSGHGTTPPPAQPVAKAPPKASQSSETPPATVVSDKKIETPLPEALAPAKLEPAPLEKSGWEPLDKARQARHDKPTEFNTLLELYDAAEKGAAPALIPKIRSEKAEVERAMVQSFRVYLTNRTREADRKMEQKNYGAALGMFIDGDFPAAVMSEFTKAELGKVRAEFENRVADIFNKTDKQDLTKELQAAGNDSGKLTALKEKIKSLEAVWSNYKPAQDFLRSTDQRADQILKQVAGAADRAADMAYQIAVDAANHAARRDDLPGALKKLEEAGGNQALMGKYGAQVAAFKADLAAVEELYQKAGEAVAAKVGTPEPVEVWVDGSKIAGPVISKGGSAQGPAVIIKDGAGQPQSVPYAKLDPGDALHWAQIKTDTPQGRYLTGATRFWKGSYAKSIEMLKPLKAQKPIGDKAEYYLAIMENRAGQILDAINAIGRELHDQKLPPEKETEKRQQLQRWIDKLTKDYALTEAYHARTGR
ncbi:MAG: serine/threonine protein kinase [Planctomycetes bacterium]|nr:serine/threonine protein kinase [Planctomycetota bacterium]